MRIMKVLNKKVGNVEYVKYRVNLPKKVVEETKLLGKKIAVRADKDRIIIEKEE